VIYQRKVIDNKERVEAYLDIRILSSTCFRQIVEMTKFLFYKMLVPLFDGLLSNPGSKYKEVQEELMMKTNSVHVLKENVKSLHKELQRKTSKIASLEVDVLACKMQACCVQNANESQKKIIANLQQNVAELKSVKSQKIADVSSAAEKYSVELDRKTYMVEELTAEVQQMADQIANLELLVKCSRVEIKEKSEEIKTYAAINSSLTMEVQERNILIDSLRFDV